MKNQITLVGRLGKDPESRLIGENQTRVTQFAIAVNDDYKDKSGQWVKQSDWHQIKCFGKMAEKLQHLRKGDEIVVGGKLKYEKWEDKEGVKRKAALIHPYDVKLCRKIEPVVAAPTQTDADDFDPELDLG